MTSISRSCRVVVGTLLLLCAAAWATTQDAGTTQNAGLDLYGEQLRDRLDGQASRAMRFSFDYGAWLTVAAFDYEPLTDTDDILRRYELRLWTSVNLQGAHRFYFRAATSYDGWNGADDLRDAIDTEPDFEIERAWYQFHLGSLVRRRTGRKPDVDVRTTIGRQFMTVGTGLAFHMPLDAVRFNVSVPNWRVMAFLGRTIDDSRSICDWRLASMGEERIFYGFQATYLGIPRHRPFVYYFRESDLASPWLFDGTRAYDYSPRYVGIGSTGVLLAPRLRYRAEVVGEWGRTYSDGGTESRSQDEICAWAVNLALERRFRVPTRPRIAFEYILTSGDRDRSTGSPNEPGRNRTGTKDNAFNAFGFRDMGLWLSPQTGNLRMVSLDMSFFPYENVRLLRNMEVGTTLYCFRKHRSAGPINDTTATVGANSIGWEWDLYCNWRVTRSLTWTMRYGVFRPGPAYDRENDDIRRFLYTALILNF